MLISNWFAIFLHSHIETNFPFYVHFPCKNDDNRRKNEEKGEKKKVIVINVLLLLFEMLGI